MRAIPLAIVLILGGATMIRAAEPADEVAVDLTKLSRTIADEPDYKGSPRYCLVAFGQKAQHQVWLIRDKDRLFVDLNGDGRLTEPPFGMDRSSVTIGELNLPRTGGRYNRFRVYSKSDGTTRISVNIEGRGYQIAGAMREPSPTFGSSPEKAPVVHFDGRLTLHQYGSLQTLPRETAGKSYRTTSLKLMVGTPGLGKGTFAAIHCKCRRNKTLRGQIAWPRGEYDPFVERVACKMHG
ncbi:MAG: hypothetical protein H8E37_03955 [Planctomycetes bacterium]|nr:hypothetical protein [Planctomycetota bacterium]